MSNGYYIDSNAPVSNTINAIVASIVSEWGNARSNVVVRQARASKARKRPDNKIVIEEERDASGRLHCEHGAALNLFVPGTAGPILEAHFIAGRAHRALGPCMVQRAPSSYLVLRELFGENDVLHNRWKPAIVDSRSVTSDARTRETWMWRGKLHRVCGPAEIRRDAGSKRATHAEWHVFGEPLAVMDLSANPSTNAQIIDLHGALVKSGTFPSAIEIAGWPTSRRERGPYAEPSVGGGPK